jgi:hypothetical protein
MWSLVDGIMREQLKPLMGTRPTAHPRIAESVGVHTEGEQPLFGEVSAGIVSPTVQSQSSKGSPILELI